MNQCFERQNFVILRDCDVLRHFSPDMGVQVCTDLIKSSSGRTGPLLYSVKDEERRKVFVCFRQELTLEELRPRVRHLSLIHI